MNDPDISRQAGKWLAALEALNEQRRRAVYAIADGKQGFARQNLQNIKGLADQVLREINDEVSP